MYEYKEKKEASSGFKPRNNQNNIYNLKESKNELTDNWVVDTKTNEDGSQMVKLTLNMDILNTSGNVQLAKEENHRKLMSAIQKQIKETLDGSFTRKNELRKVVSVELSTEVNLKMITSIEKRTEGHHLLKIVKENTEDLGEDYGFVDKIGGKVIIISDVTANETLFQGHDKKTIIHELGHTLGLLHPTKRNTWVGDIFRKKENRQFMNKKERKANPENVMYSGDYHTNDSERGTLSEKQRRILVEKVEKGEVNQL